MSEIKRKKVKSLAPTRTIDFEYDAGTGEITTYRMRLSLATRAQRQRHELLSAEFAALHIASGGGKRAQDESMRRLLKAGLDAKREGRDTPQNEYADEITASNVEYVHLVEVGEGGKEEVFAAEFALRDAQGEVTEEDKTWEEMDTAQRIGLMREHPKLFDAVARAVWPEANEELQGKLQQQHG